MLHWDVNNGIARRSWARNEGAEWAIRRAMEHGAAPEGDDANHADDDLIARRIIDAYEEEYNSFSVW